VNVSPITIPNFRPNCSKSIPVFRPKRLINHTLWGGTYLYTWYRGVPPGKVLKPGIFIVWLGLLAFCPRNRCSFLGFIESPIDLVSSAAVIWVVTQRGGRSVAWRLRRRLLLTSCLLVLSIRKSYSYDERRNYSKKQGKALFLFIDNNNNTIYSVFSHEYMLVPKSFYSFRHRSVK